MSKMLSKMNLISVVQQLPKEDIETIQGYVEMIEDENKKLKKQYEKVLNDYCRLDAYNRTQQKKFIDYLENEIYSIEPKGTGINYNCEYDSEEVYRVYGYEAMLNYTIMIKILQKYKEIIGDDK